MKQEKHYLILISDEEMSILSIILYFSNLFCSFFASLTGYTFSCLSFIFSYLEAYLFYTYYYSTDILKYTSSAVQQVFI